MGSGNVKIFYGEGRGKSDAALGRALQVAAQGKNVVIIQFMKERNEATIEFMKRMEPEIKFFRFEKKDKSFQELTDEEKKEEIMNIKNGMNFAKKVLQTGECDLLVLDEILGVVDCNIIGCEELGAVLGIRGDNTDVIFTGRVLCDKVAAVADEICCIEQKK